MARLLLATNNQGKRREISALLADLELELVLPGELGLNLQVEETGSTYAENAAKKALAFAKASGLPALGDDSGLEVDALDGGPGLYSARYSPMPNATDADRRLYLLEKLQGKPRPWTARFRCVVALAFPGPDGGPGQVQFAEGVCEGEIIPEERGTGGFGYDPIFFIPEAGRTMAELSMDEKNQLSHRARAIRAARPLLAF